MAEKDLNKLLEKFNKLDVSPMTTRDYVLGLEQAKSGVKNLTQKEADKLFPDKLTDEDINNLREAREQEVAIKRGLIAANQAKTVTKRTRAIANAGKPTKAGLQSLNFFKKEREEAKQREVDIEKLKQEFQPQAQLVKNIDSTTKGFSSGVQNLPALVNPEKSSKKKAADILDAENTANFDYDFLISTKGELNKDPLMDILISTWDETHSVEDLDKLDKMKKDKKGSGDEDSGMGLLDALLGMSFLDFFFSPIKKLSKAAFKKLRKIGKKIVNAIKKPFKKIIKMFKKGIKKVKKFIKNMIKQGQKAVKNMIKTAKKQAKNLIKQAKSSAKKAIKAAKSKAKALTKKAKNAAKALKKEAKQVLKQAKSTAKNIIKQAKNKVKSGVDKVKNVAKKGASKIKSGAKAFGKKVLNKAKSGVDKAKNLAKKGVDKAKNLAKAGASKAKSTIQAGKDLVKNSKTVKVLKSGAKAGKGVTKGILSKVPVVSAAVDLGFMASDINEIQNETGGTVDQAMETYLDEMKKEGHSWWEVIDPFRFGQQIALDLGIDKLAEKAVDWTMDKFMDSPEERQRKIREKAESEAQEKQARLQQWREERVNAQQPQEIENPDYRYKEESEVEQTIQPIVVVQDPKHQFEGDGDELPYGGLSYSGAY